MSGETDSASDASESAFIELEVFFVVGGDRDGSLILCIGYESVECIAIGSGVGAVAECVILDGEGLEGTCFLSFAVDTGDGGLIIFVPAEDSEGEGYESVCIDEVESER